MTTTTLIRALNDHFRTTFEDGRVIAAPSVLAHGPLFLAKAHKAIRAFNDFTPEGDPSGEHAAGEFMIDGIAIGWSIEYDNNSWGLRPLDPSNVQRTQRVLVIY